MPDDIAERDLSERAPRVTGKRFFDLVGRFAAINVLIRGFGLITGPLMARALGPTGRGEVAAILAPLMFVPVIAMLGLAAYAGRQVARGASPGVILGSVALPLLVTGGSVAVLAVPLADFLAEDRETVRTFLILGFALMPLGLIGQLLIAVTSGLEEWRSVIVARLIPPVMGLIGVVVLYVAGELTVATAATVTIAASVAQMFPGLMVVIRRRAWPRVRLPVVREGTAFGLKAWVGQISANANARLDQLLMVRLVPSHELGLYAVGVNAASVAPLFFTALGTPLSIRVARGEVHLVGRAARSAMLVSAVIAVALALLLPVALPLLFGSDFSDAVLMAQILLLHTIPAAGRGVLISSLTAAGRPGAGAIAQLVGLGVTVPALLLVLPWLGGVGAAIVSVLATTATFATILPIAKRHFEVGYGELLIPRPRDVRWAWEQLPRPRLRRRRS